ncbi:glycosyl hydrolase family 95 catalytic domain-containing protein [Luteipulveratus mongoliensis]|uniref:Ricin B lectin n=1 Tax=Luteipulveratus mongoliensis TaxID=571913 RepID=A0A0K1JFR5_9MICO|nr:glycoside hydrolase N-terminal domain-containing protein [Luteipulveratus mongoliensis]AKU15562.1 ricin B lectin [Luteipulveratus mongoliensis]
MTHESKLPSPSRRDLLKLGGLGAALSLGGLPAFAPRAAAVVRPAEAGLVPDSAATTLWYRAPGSVPKILEEGLPVGNGRLGALVTSDPAADTLYVTDATLWTGGLNDSLQSDGQFSYETTNFGTLSMLAKATVEVPGHTSTAIADYQRQLDLSNGFVSARYTAKGVTYRRDVYVSHPDDVLVIRLTQSGGGSYTGSVALAGTHGESTTAAGKVATFGGTLGNGLRYGAALTAVSKTGTIATDGSRVTFTGCEEVLILIAGGTNYVPNPKTQFKNPGLDPVSVSRGKVADAAAVSASHLLATHVADYRRLYDASTVNLGASTPAQRALDTPTRLATRAEAGATPDPELEASYLQFGRYLTITGSRDSVPTNLQGLWLDRNDPDWMADYHTDINLQMNYWLPDRAGLGGCFDAFADYCVSQLPCWTSNTQKLFNDSRNRFRNTSGKVAGWTTAISTNIFGGNGWWWHPAGSAWLCHSLFEHYQFTQDKAYLRKIYPLLKGACEFWESRLVTTTVDGKEVLVDDHDWSPEHGPEDTRGNTYSQELVWELFREFAEAAKVLGRDASYARTVDGLRAKLYLPAVSPTSGWFEEWMSPDNLGETTHRHLSPLIGLHPGDRITADTSPPELLTGVRSLLTARGMNSFGWAMAWRGLCWARLKDADKAYQAVLTVMKPSVDFSNGAAINFFDMYSFGDRSTFQIDANYGTPTAMLEMLVYSRPGVIELLPATPDAWRSGHAKGLGARGGFVVDLDWSDGQVSRVTIHSIGGTSTALRVGAWSKQIRLARGRSVTITPPRHA